MHDPDFMIQPMVFILDGGIMIYGDGSEIADMKDLDSITVAQWHSQPERTEVS